MAWTDNGWSDAVPEETNGLSSQHNEIPPHFCVTMLVCQRKQAQKSSVPHEVQHVDHLVLPKKNLRQLSAADKYKREYQKTLTVLLHFGGEIG